MKKIMTIVLVVTLLFVFVGCSSTEVGNSNLVININADEEISSVKVISSNGSRYEMNDNSKLENGGKIYFDMPLVAEEATFTIKAYNGSNQAILNHEFTASFDSDKVVELTIESGSSGLTVK